MGKLRKKICRKMAAVLSVCMMLVSVAPLIGYAKVYDEAPISNDSLGLPDLATMPNAAVRVQFPEQRYDMVIDELKEEKELNFNVSVELDKLASPANASSSDWDAEAWGAQIASELDFEATIDESSLWLSDRIGLSVRISTNPYALVVKATTPENMKYMENYNIQVRLRTLTDNVSYPELSQVADSVITLSIVGSGADRGFCIPVQNPKWVDVRPGWVTWDQNTLSDEEKYDVRYTATRLFRDGQLLNSKNGTTSSGYHWMHDLRQHFTEPGEYTFQSCLIMGNVDEVPEEYWSDVSDPFNYVLPDKTVSTPKNLSWSPDGTVTWDKVPEVDLLQYDGANKYAVYLYVINEKSGKYDRLKSMYKVKENKVNVSSALMKGRTYMFRVVALGDLVEYANSEWSDFSSEFLLDPMIKDGSEIIGNLLDSDDIKASVENTVLPEPDKGALKLAIQLSKEVADRYAELEENYKEAAGKDDFSIETESSIINREQVTVTGGLLNGATGIRFDNTSAEDLNKANVSKYREKSAINITLTGEASGKLNYPVLITMPIPSGMIIKNTGDLLIIHMKHDGSVENIEPRINGDGTVSFAVSEFSTFFFVDSASTSSGSSGGGGGGSSFTSSGTVTVDSKKGKVSSVTGIITGSGEGYSKWISETLQEGAETRWKLKYADGTFAAGYYVMDEQGNPVKDAAGNPVEQPHWEMINGAWYAFGIDSYVKTGLVFDPALNGWFYVDVNAGMKTGWQHIDGKWYYFNPLSDGAQGKMAVSTTVDGYMIDESGVWIP